MTSKKQTTKNKILETTIELLNEKGISNVTMRDVSQKLDISVGNLTYHYPKWELLIDDIFIRFQADIEEMYKVYPYDISEVVAYINKIYAIQIKYTFLFSNFYIFFRLYPKYKEIKDAFFHQRMIALREALQRLEEKDFLYPADKKHNYDLLVKNTWLVLSSWYGFSVMFSGSSYAFTKEEFFLSMWNLYVHHLTLKGKNVVRRSYVDIKKRSL